MDFKKQNKKYDKLIFVKIYFMIPEYSLSKRMKMVENNHENWENIEQYVKRIELVC